MGELGNVPNPPLLIDRLSLFCVQDEFSIGRLFHPQRFERRGGGTLDRVTVAVEAASVTGAGESIGLNLHGATKVTANQAQGCELAVVIDKDCRDFGQGCL